MMRDRVVEFKVKCNRDRHSIYDMGIKLFYIEDKERYMNEPCNGCDNASNSKECNMCMTKITSMFFENPDLDVTEPLVIKKD